MWMMMMYEKEVMIILPAFDFGFYFQRKAHFPVTGTLCFELPGGKQKYLLLFKFHIRDANLKNVP